MSLSADQKARVFYFLGYSIFEDDGPLVRILASIDGRPEAEPIILRDLDELTAVDDQIRKVRVLSMAVQDGAIQTRGHYTLGVLRSMGEQVVGRIASFLSVPIKRNVFAAGAPGAVSGDPFGGDRPYTDVLHGSGGCT